MVPGGGIVREVTAGPAAPRRDRAPSPGRYAKGMAKRRQIVDTAIAVFADVGFNASSLRDIAARAGISHPGLMHYFPTKAALLEAVLRYRDDVDVAALDEELARGTDFFEAVVHLTERNQVRRPVVELFAAVAAEATSPAHPAHGYFVARYASTVSSFRGRLEQAGAAGRLRPGVDPEHAARNLVAVLDGLQVQWLLSLDGPRDERIDMAAHLRAHLSLLLDDGPAPPATTPTGRSAPWADPPGHA